MPNAEYPLRIENPSPEILLEIVKNPPSGLEILEGEVWLGVEGVRHPICGKMGRKQVEDKYRELCDRRQVLPYRVEGYGFDIGTSTFIPDQVLDTRVFNFPYSASDEMLRYCAAVRADECRRPHYLVYRFVPLSSYVECKGRGQGNLSAQDVFDIFRDEGGELDQRLKANRIVSRLEFIFSGYDPQTFRGSDYRYRVYTEPKLVDNTPGFVELLGDLDDLEHTKTKTILRWFEQLREKSSESSDSRYYLQKRVLKK